MDKDNERAWETKAREAFEAYLAKLKAALPADADFALMEQKMLEHSPEMMSKTLEALANAEDFSPENKRET
jgi:molecular chaperone DnaK (HSP70)